MLNSVDRMGVGRAGSHPSRVTCVVDDDFAQRRWGMGLAKELDTVGCIARKSMG